MPVESDEMPAIVRIDLGRTKSRSRGKLPRWSFGIVLFILLLLSATPSIANDTESQIAFFENKVRPLLVERCYECHSVESGKSKGGLFLDSKAGWAAGGETGPALIPGRPDESLLVKAVKYVDEKLQMPPKKRLTEAEVKVLTDWVTMGAPDPREGGTVKKSKPGFEERRKSWAFQPPKPASPPKVTHTAWPKSAIDHFILAKLEEKGLVPAAPADKRMLIRRATFDLTGLPPTPEDVEAFLNDDSADAFVKVVDRLLASPHYGERWARHWLDTVRYTDSFDARIVTGAGSAMDSTEAYRYRDWVVKAFNQDLPYDQFVTYQIAGDILANQKDRAFDPDMIVATGVYAIGNWGGGDADKEKLLTDIADDQVDLTSRAFLGVTLACARCHDHKFDPFTTEDYYGLAGIFFSTHILPNPGPKTNGPEMLRIPLLSPEEIERRSQREAHMRELEQWIEKETDNALIAFARSLVPQTAGYLEAASGYALRTPESASLSLEDYLTAHSNQARLVPAVVRQWSAYLGTEIALFANGAKDIAGNPALLAWKPDAKMDTPSLTVNKSDQPVSFSTITLPEHSVAVHPSPKDGVAVGWKSPITGTVRISGGVSDADDKCGNGIDWSLGLRAGKSVQKIAEGSIDNGGKQAFPGNGPQPLEIQVRQGQMIQLAVFPKGDYSCDTTVVELVIQEQGGEKRAWNLSKEVVPDLLAGNPHADLLGHGDVWQFYDLGKDASLPKPAPDTSLAKWVAAVEAAVTNRAELEGLRTAAQSVEAELVEVCARSQSSTNLGPLGSQFLNPRHPFWAPIRNDESILSSGSRDKLSSWKIELAQLKNNPPPPPAIAHGLQEGGCPQSPQAGIHDVRVHMRGRYDRLGEMVPRRFPEVLAGARQAAITNGSGRLELARWVSSPQNPLTARVMANRIWQHHFGEGIVRTANNFGKLGTPPTHPELLDYLADAFVASGWSVKAMHRAIMLSAAYQQSSVPDPATLKEDPDNLLFGRMNRRRLESEAIRDSLMAAAGKLNLDLGGPSVRDFNTPRRTLYVMTIRSDRATYQSMFDAADPTAIVEKRIDSTVAPQALFLLNHPFVLTQAESLTDRTLKQSGGELARIRWLYATLYGRLPTAAEEKIGLNAIKELVNQSGGEVNSGQNSRTAWSEYCQALLCANEFVYVD